MTDIVIRYEREWTTDGVGPEWLRWDALSFADNLTRERVLAESYLVEGSRVGTGRVRSMVLQGGPQGIWVSINALAQLLGVPVNDIHEVRVIDTLDPRF